LPARGGSNRKRLLVDTAATDLHFLIPLLQGEVTPLIRTDVSDEPAWARIVESVTARLIVSETEPEISDDDGGYSPNIEPINDPAFTDSDAQAFADAWQPHRAEATGYVLLANAQSMHEAVVGREMTVVYVDLYARDGDAELG
jgi:Domain of unknown function (DUF6924)